jgi:hypothetical protein
VSSLPSLSCIFCAMFGPINHSRRRTYVCRSVRRPSSLCPPLPTVPYPL